MGSFHSLLVTRSRGKQVKELISIQLQNEKDWQVLLLDFTEVQVLDYSWADECIAKLAAEVNADLYGSRGIIVTSCTDDQAENISAALLQRNLTLLRLQETESTLLGELKEPFLSTLSFVNQQKKVTARDVADYFQLAINTASNRLSEIYKRHLALRQEEVLTSGGKQFIYSSLLLALEPKTTQE
jgi:hypothetical protein